MYQSYRHLIVDKYKGEEEIALLGLSYSPNLPPSIEVYNEIILFRSIFFLFQIHVVFYKLKYVL
jgi:hypothetical protein